MKRRDRKKLAKARDFWLAINGSKNPSEGAFTRAGRTASRAAITTGGLTFAVSKKHDNEGSLQSAAVLGGVAAVIAAVLSLSRSSIRGVSRR